MKGVLLLLFCITEDNREKRHSKTSESRKDASSKSVKEKIKAFESSTQVSMPISKERQKKTFENCTYVLLVIL